MKARFKAKKCFFKGGIIFNLKRGKDKQTIQKARFLVFRNSR